jgi:hypothetical protein
LYVFAFAIVFTLLYCECSSFAYEVVEID